MGQLGSRRAEVPSKQDLPRGAVARSPSKPAQSKRTASPEKGEKREQEKLVKKTPPITTPAPAPKPIVKSSISKASASQPIHSQADIPSSSTGGTGRFNQQPSGSVSRQAQTEQQIKKAQLKEQKESAKAAEGSTEVPRQSLTPTMAFTS